MAALIIKALPASEHVVKTDIAGPGFINFFLSAASVYSVIGEILTAEKNYGQSTIGAGKKVQVEFVSANPTGPLHVGHGRGAAQHRLCHLGRDRGMNPAGEVGFLDSGLRHEAVHRLEMGRLTRVRCAGQCQLDAVQSEALVDPVFQERHRLERLRGGAPPGHLIGIAGRGEQPSLGVDHGHRDAMGGFDQGAAGGFDTESGGCHVGGR